MLAIGLATVSVASASGCAKDDSAKGAHMKTVVIPVEGMSCGSCAGKVKRTLKDINGVGEAVVDLAERRVTVDYDPRQLAPERLVAAINGLGYKAGAPAEAPK